MFNEKFTVYVDSVHHRHFVIKDSPHYALLKHRIATMHASRGGSMSIKREKGEASTNHQASEEAPTDNTSEKMIKLEENPSENQD